MPAKEKSPAFQFYPNDFLGSGAVAAMSIEEVGLYTLLLCYDWNEGGLPDDPLLLSRLTRVHPSKFKKIWNRVKPNFSLDSDGRWYNPRLQVERRKQLERKQQAHDAAAKRWENAEKNEHSGSNADADATAYAGAMPTQCPPSPSPSPSPTPLTTKAKASAPSARASRIDVLPKADCDALFEKWGKEIGAIPYPRFRKAFLVVRSTEAGRAFTLQELLDAIEAFSEWFKEQSDREQRFISIEKGFVDQIPRWVRLGKMPLTRNGELTERGAVIGTKLRVAS